jgi:hypothetical protein
MELIYNKLNVTEKQQERENEILICLHNFPSVVEILLPRKKLRQSNQSSNKSKLITNLFGRMRLKEILPFFCSKRLIPYLIRLATVM